MGWVAKKERDSEAADFKVSAAEGIKEGGVGRGAKSTRFVIGGAVGLMERAVMGGEQVGKMCEVSRGWWGGGGGC